MEPIFGIKNELGNLCRIDKPGSKTFGDFVLQMDVHGDLRILSVWSTKKTPFETDGGVSYLQEIGVILDDSWAVQYADFVGARKGPLDNVNSWIFLDKSDDLFKMHKINDYYTPTVPTHPHMHYIPGQRAWFWVVGPKEKLTEQIPKKLNHKAFKRFMGCEKSFDTGFPVVDALKKKWTLSLNPLDDNAGRQYLWINSVPWNQNLYRGRKLGLSPGPDATKPGGLPAGGENARYGQILWMLETALINGDVAAYNMAMRVARQCAAQGVVYGEGRYAGMMYYEKSNGDFPGDHSYPQYSHNFSAQLIWAHFISGDPLLKKAKDALMKELLVHKEVWPLMWGSRPLDRRLESLTALLLTEDDSTEIVKAIKKVNEDAFAGLRPYFAYDNIPGTVIAWMDWGVLSRMAFLLEHFGDNKIFTQEQADLLIATIEWYAINGISAEGQVAQTLSIENGVIVPKYMYAGFYNTFAAKAMQVLAKAKPQYRTLFDKVVHNLYGNLTPNFHTGSASLKTQAGYQIGARQDILKDANTSNGTN